MKLLFFILLHFIFFNVYSQTNRINPHPIQNSLFAEDINLSNDTTFDVKFYHLDLEIGIDEEYISGSVEYLFASNIDSLNKVILDLDGTFEVDSVSYPANSFSFSNNRIVIGFDNYYSNGETFSFKIYYHGKPQLYGGIKGLVYKKHSGNQPIIASLSTPYLAHTWWPCKDGVFDKSDSTFIDITIKDTIISSIPVIAVSNGLLDEVEVKNGKKTFKWKHYYPIVPYYVMVAISNYRKFSQTFEGEGYSFPLDYYVFDEHIEQAKKGVINMPDAIGFFTEIFGSYPFLNEKYGMTELGFYGAIENQTNTITNSMKESWFYVSVHELSHQWFADMITCDSWHDGWLNEGFASYAEALYAEHSEGFERYQSYMAKFEYYDSGTVYMEDVNNPFNVFRGIIYKKGAYILHMLRYVLGDKMFFKAIKEYALDEKFMYKNARTEDFQEICESVSGKNLNYFFDQWIYDERYPIYHYNFNQKNEKLDIYIEQKQNENGWRNIFKMPVEIKVEFEDGGDTLVKVFNELQFQIFSFDMTKAVKAVKIDPGKKILKKAFFDNTLTSNYFVLPDRYLNIYPNPNSGSFSIQIDVEELSGAIELSVISLNNDIVYKNIIIDDSQSLINIEGIKPGMYFVIIKSKSIYSVKKMIVTQ